MLKASLISLNFIALILLKFFLGGEITINQTIPETINSGDTFTVEVLIEKGDQEGFAKWQQKLPEGFIASLKESEGATFSFKNQEVKLIWMALPKDESVTISYEITMDPSISGDFELLGKFSYIEENERKDILSNSSTIKIQPSLIAEEQNQGDNSNAEINAKNNSNENANKSSDLVTDDESIKIKRTISHLGNAEYRVDLELTKGSFNSFGKIEEYVPEGFIASNSSSEDGIFTFKNGVAKILWMSLPIKPTLNVSYLLKSESDLLEMATVHGVFSYLNQTESIQLELKPSRFKNYLVAEEEVLASNEELVEKAAVSNDNSNIIEEESIESNQEMADNSDTENQNIQENSITEVESNSSISEQENQLIESITSIPSAETNINYKVQIAAGRKEVEEKYFEKNHKISESIAIEYHNNWYKYTVGKYDVYKQARDKRNDIWNKDNKINDAFVTAYNAGERVSVQEALMISQQKWYK